MFFGRGGDDARANSTSMRAGKPHAMGSLSLQEKTEGDLTTALFRIASDPTLVTALHQILGTFCHQGRNVLNSLKLNLYLAQRCRPDCERNRWEDLEACYGALEQLFDRLQAICRPMPLTPVRASLGLLMEEGRSGWAEAMSAHDRPFELVAPSKPAIGDFDPVRMRDGLDVFINWRARAGEPGQPASLSWSADRRAFHLDWDEPGSSGPSTVAEHGDSPDPFALPLLARVISSHGGSLDLNRRHGLHMSVRWPREFRP
jgi:hypothetical protein